MDLASSSSMYIFLSVLEKRINSCYFFSIKNNGFRVREVSVRLHDASRVDSLLCLIEQRSNDLVSSFAICISVLHRIIYSRLRISINDGRFKVTDIASFVSETSQHRFFCRLEQHSVDFVSASSMYIAVLGMRIDSGHRIEVNNRCFKVREIASFVSAMLQHRLSLFSYRTTSDSSLTIFVNANVHLHLRSRHENQLVSSFVDQQSSLQGKRLLRPFSQRVSIDSLF
jgi:hypothetical protein